MARRPRSSAGAAGAALLALVAVAASLRAVGVRYGLPYPLLNPDEGSIVPRAWRMVHGGGLDPHWFDYPTLVMYLLAPFQAWQRAPSILAARIVILVLGVACVPAAWWLGARAYGRRAALVAAAVLAVATTHVAYSRMAVTDVPLTLFASVSLTLMLSGRLEWAGLAVGLATGAKYPGVFLAVPVLVAGWGRWRRTALALALGTAAFFATSPFMLVHPRQAAHDALRVQRLARNGWLGFEHDGTAPVAFLDRLWHGLGPVLAVAVAGLALALWRRRRSDLVLASFALFYFLDLMTLRAHFDRYTLPLLPPLAALAGGLAETVRPRLAVPAALGLLVVPLVWAAQDAAQLTKTDTRVVAARWLAAHLPAGAAVAAESSTPPLPFARVLPLQLPGPGRSFDRNRDVARLRADGVRYVLVSGAVADRVLAARRSYPREARFYDELRRDAATVYELRPDGRLGGPWVALYRL